jgi:hypothetical protein
MALFGKTNKKIKESRRRDDVEQGQEGGSVDQGQRSWLALIE